MSIALLPTFGVYGWVSYTFMLSSVSQSQFLSWDNLWLDYIRIWSRNAPMREKLLKACCPPGTCQGHVRMSLAPGLGYLVWYPHGFHGYPKSITLCFYFQPKITCLLLSPLCLLLPDFSQGTGPRVGYHLLLKWSLVCQWDRVLLPSPHPNFRGRSCPYIVIAEENIFWKELSFFFLLRDTKGVQNLSVLLSALWLFQKSASFFWKLSQLQTQQTLNMCQRKEKKTNMNQQVQKHPSPIWNKRGLYKA